MALERAESHENHALFEVRDLDAASIVLELDLALDTVHVVIGQGSVQIYNASAWLAGGEGLHTCTVKLKFLDNAGANTRVFPESRALDTGAGGARAVTGTLVMAISKITHVRSKRSYRFFQHPTTNTCPPLPHFLDFPAPGRREPSSHLGLRRLGRIAKFIHKTFRLRVGIHRDGTGEAGSTLRRSRQRGVVFLEAVEEELVMARTPVSAQLG